MNEQFHHYLNVRCIYLPLFYKFNTHITHFFIKIIVSQEKQHDAVPLMSRLLKCKKLKASMLVHRMP